MKTYTVYIGEYQETLKEWFHTVNPEIVCFVYLSNEGYYGVQTTADPSKPFRKSKSRKLFPDQWLGLRDGDLAFVSGLKSAFFCSDQGYIAGFWEKEDAIKAAEYITQRFNLLEEFNLL